MPKVKKQRKVEIVRKLESHVLLNNTQSKKLSRQEKRADFLQRLHQTKGAIKKDKDVNEYGKGFGNISNLAEALYEYKTESKSNSEKSKSNHISTTPQRKTLRNKQRKKLALQEIQLFQQVLVHPAFKQNAAASISEHLRNNLKQEQEHV